MRIITYILFFFIVLFFTFIQEVISQTTFTISGFIRAEQGSEPLIGATVYDSLTQTGIVSNEYGYYSFTGSLLNRDKVYLIVSHVGYEKKIIKVNNFKGEVQDILLKNLDLPEFVVSQQRFGQPGVVSLPIESLAKIPALAGEVDVLKALTFLPGIARGAEGSSNLYVRGGSQDQNLFLLDGAPVYNPNHIGGYLSVFQSEALKNISVIKGGIPARYGGRLSSVVDINFKEGNLNKWQASGSLGLITSGLLLEGPLVKDKVSLMLGGRLFYFGSLLKLFSRSSGGEQTYYNFDDANAKLQLVLSPKSRMFASFYTGSDVSITEDIFEDKNEKRNSVYKVNWSNQIISLRYFHTLNDRIFLKLTASNTLYKSTNTDENRNFFISSSERDSTYESTEFKSNIKDYAVQADLNWNANRNNNFTMGVRSEFHYNLPGKTRFFTFNQDTLIGSAKDAKASEFIVFGDYKLKVNSLFEIQLGGRGIIYQSLSTIYRRIDPRIAFILNSTQTQIKVAYDRVHQFSHLLTTSRLAAPNDIWVFSDSIIPPQGVHQFSLACYSKERLKGSWSVELYYKKLENQITVKTIQNSNLIFARPDWQNFVFTDGRGWAYGAEFFGKRQLNKWDISVAYTLSWSWRQFDKLNLGDIFPFRYDRRHNLNILGVCQLSKKWSLSFAGVFTSGEAFTFTNGVIKSYPIFYYSMEINNKINNGRLPNYHRLDVSLINEKSLKNYTRRLTFGIYNLYARKNPNYIYTRSSGFNNSTDASGQVVFFENEDRKVYQSSIFPLIPSVSYSIVFK
jgi:hypothetical protein